MFFLEYCVDPGTPVHGSRNVDRTDGRFPDGTTVSFQCNANYKLSGAKKIVCTKGRWSEKKLPWCISQGMWCFFLNYMFWFYIFWETRLPLLLVSALVSRLSSFGLSPG